jgi:FtsH-binding integral membrane protein
MENNSRDYVYENVIQIDDADSSRKFIANVFMWMFAALALSAVCTYLFAFDPSLANMLRDPLTGRNNVLGTVVMFAPLAFVLTMSFAFNKLSYSALILFFLAFAAVMGISLSYIFLAYSTTLISSVFITTSVVFGIMAVAGYTTSQDLTKFGAILTMFLIGIIVASLLNMLIFRSEGLDMLVSYLGVAIFVGLTAYDVQKLKRIGAGLEYGNGSAKKMAIMGALTLYLDFINLFLMLLRVFGGRRR